MKKETFYFLLGGNAVNAYHEDGINAVKKHLNNFDGGTSKIEFDPDTMTTSDLVEKTMLTTDGWTSYILIDKTTYEQLQ